MSRQAPKTPGEQQARKPLANRTGKAGNPMQTADGPPLIKRGADEAQKAETTH